MAGRTTERGRRSEVQEATDPFGYDPEVHELVRPVLRFLFERYWRVQVEGIEHIPRRGAAILVANHSGAIPIDASMIAAAVEFRAPSPRLVRFLYDRFVEQMPLVGTFYRKVGSVPARFGNAAALLARGELVGIFPEGVAGVAKGFGRRYRLQPFRTGFVRLSLACRAPIIPTAVVGAEEAYPVIARWERLGPLGRFLGLPYVPVTPLFPWFGVLGAVPLPTRWYIRFGAPVVLCRGRGCSQVRTRTARILAQEVRRRIQQMVHELLAQRPSVF